MSISQNQFAFSHKRKIIKNWGKLRGHCAACQWVEELSMSPSWVSFPKGRHGDVSIFSWSHTRSFFRKLSEKKRKKRWTRDWEANEGLDRYFSTDLGQDAQSHSVLWYKHHYALQVHILEQSEQIWVMGLWGKGAPHRGMNLSTWRSPKPRRQQNPWQELLTCNERIC